ncbi:MAG: hypothetical protein R3C03_23360 [Pirellulaceae bacterium]
MTSLSKTRVAHVPKLNKDVWSRLKLQARLQAASLDSEVPQYELIPPPPKDAKKDAKAVGFQRLPEPCEYDIFFDMEGYPLINGGLEYLFGAVVRKGDSYEFKDWWAHDRDQGKKHSRASLIGPSLAGRRIQICTSTTTRRMRSPQSND